MGGRKQQKVASTSTQPGTVDPSSVNPSGSKRPRRDEVDPSEYNARLLAKNKFAPLPVQQIQSKVKIPPLFAATKEVAALRNELAGMQTFPLFKLCSVGTKVMCANMEVYTAVAQYLRAKKMEYYTHDTPASKPLKVIIRGLPEYSPEEISEELVKAKLKPQKVFPIKRVKAGNHRDVLYLVHLEKGSTSMAELMKTKSLFQVIIKWEKYRPKKRDVTQCGKCLAFGHGSKNCHMQPRCGRCAGKHDSTTCPSADDSAEPKCVNCNGNHEAIDRNCPKRAEYIEIRRQASTRNQHGRQQRGGPPPVTEEHFPVLQNYGPNLPPPQPNHRQASRPTVRTIQHRFAAAAASTPPWGDTEGTNPAPQPSTNGSLYSTEEVTELTLSLYRRLRSCRSKQQIKAATSAVMEFINKYGP